MREVKTIALAPIEAPYAVLETMSEAIDDIIEEFKGRLTKTPKNSRLYMFYSDIKVLEDNKNTLRLYKIADAKSKLDIGLTSEFSDNDIFSEMAGSLYWISKYCTGELCNATAYSVTGTESGDIGLEPMTPKQIQRANPNKVYFAISEEFKRFAIESSPEGEDSFKSILLGSTLIVASGEKQHVKGEKYFLMTKKYNIQYGRR